MLTNKPACLIFCITLTAVLGWLDYLSGYDLGFFIFYFIPVSIAAWKSGSRWSAAMAVICAVTWGAVDTLSNHPYSNHLYMYWNAAIRLIAFLTFALALSKLHRLLREQRVLVKDLTLALDEVKQLKGFIPICASCKKIRNDKGYWEQIEKYISDRSDAEFTHGICPECIEKLYPKAWEEMVKEEASVEKS